MDPAALLEGLTAAQREAVTTAGAPLCILAGPGSGKTRVLTRRIAYRVATGDAAARNVLALTFTRHAAGELRRRLAALGVRELVAAGTFHAVAYAQLRRRWLDRGEHPPALLERKAALLARVLARPVPEARTGGGTPADGAPADLAGEIEWAKARMVAPADYERAAATAGRRPVLPPAVVASLYARYEDEKRRRRLIDFDDLLFLCAHALEDDEEFAAAQRWRFRHLFVDEMQDVNPLQFRLLEGWRGGRADLCVVGDPDQAIYGWNGADPSLLARFSQRFPAATVVALPDSFRSTPQVLGAALAVLGAGGGARPAGGDEPGGVSATGLRSQRPDGPAPSVRCYATDLDEARGVARAVRDRRRPGMPWSHIAVLARTNAQTAVLAEALEAAGIPARRRGGTPLLGRPDVRAALDELRHQPSATPLAGAAAGIEVAVVHELIREHRSVDPAATVDGFLAWLAATGTDLPVGPRTGPRDAAGGGDAVAVATFHAAKGLEWPVVFVAGLERGLVPIGPASGEAVEEERRLLYVALTRAETELHCSWARHRTVGGRGGDRSPSPWLAPLEAAAGPRPQPDQATRRLRVATERRRLGASRPGPTPTGGRRLVASLRDWRSATARAAGVPACVVMADRTLVAVARARPATPDELLAVPGIGPVRAERYGAALLALVADDAAVAT